MGWDYDEVAGKEIRTCDECGVVMVEGYCINGGEEYYCCDECLHKHYTQEEYLDLYDDGEGRRYPAVGFRGMRRENGGWMFGSLYDFFDEVKETTVAKEKQEEGKKK